MRDGIEASFTIEATPQDYVQETRIGFWFLGTLTWEKQVVEIALRDLQRLLPTRSSVSPRCWTPAAAGVAPSTS